MQATILGRNVETIYFGFQPAAFEGIQGLEETKAKADILDEPQVFRLGGLDFLLHGRGAPMYRYRLTSPDWTLLIAKQSVLEGISKGDADFPPFYVELSAEFTWRLGYREAAILTLDWITETFGELKSTTLSRMDITVDMTGVDFRQSDVLRFVTRARVKAVWAREEEGRKRRRADTYFSGDGMTGLYIGKGSQMARVYDKTLEVSQMRNKTWFRDVWRRGGWDGKSDVWRIEFQVRRNVLRARHLHEVEPALGKVGDLFKYLTEEWLTLRVPKDVDGDSKVYNRRLDPAWEVVQKVEWPPPGAYVETAERQRAVRVDRIVAGLASYAVSLAVVKQTSIEAIGAWLPSYVEYHYGKQGVFVSDVIARKKAKYGVG